MPWASMPRPKTSPEPALQMPGAQCAQMRGMTGQLYTKYVGIRFREVLETLAVELKLVGR